MFVCLEVDTEDVTMWKRIDEELATEFGLIHIIWGVRRTEKDKPVACKLPDTLFYANTGMEAHQFSITIQNKLSDMFSNGYKIMVIDDKTWSHEHLVSKLKIQESISIMEERELETREE